MIIITNRNIQLNKKPEERYGKHFNNKNPDELTLAKAIKVNGKWQVDIIDDDFDGDNSLEQFASEKIFKELQLKMKKEQKNCLFFVHGFNNDFSDVLERGYQLEQNYNVEVVAFSWPANGRDGKGKFLGTATGTASYLSDKREASKSYSALDRSLEKLGNYFRKYSEESMACDQHLSLFLHSMGNYLLEHYTLTGGYDKTCIFDNIIMAGADVNNEGHQDWVDKLKFRKRLYITINENDKALLSSRLKLGEEQKPRLGHWVKNLSAYNPWYIDFSDAKHVNDNSHSYFEGEPVSKNENIKHVFNKMFNGEKVECDLEKHRDMNSYVVK
ncbi:MAG: alpha/beta hydrolase [Flavobacteriales bacterium]|nr:alpha/beta hydrolase [Flavobacteriales bacterium]